MALGVSGGLVPRLLPVVSASVITLAGAGIALAALQQTGMIQQVHPSPSVKTTS